MDAILELLPPPVLDLERLRRSAAAHRRPVEEEAVRLLNRALPEPATPMPEMPMPEMPDVEEYGPPYIISDIWPEFPASWKTVTFTPAIHKGPLKYEPCCESEEETPE